ncbi:MAG: hypothetical protein WCT04_25115 [Planctomycetota bacterium]
MQRIVQSQRTPGLFALWDEQPGAPVDVSLFRDAASDKPDEPLRDRLLSGDSRGLVTAAMNRSEVLPGPEYANSFFAMHVFAELSSVNPSYLRERLWPNRLESLGALRGNVRRAKRVRLIEGDASDHLDKLETHALTADEAEGLAWVYIFPKLPFHKNVRVQAEEMQLFRDTIVRTWQAQCGASPGGFVPLSNVLTPAAKDGFRTVSIPGHESNDLYRAWVAYSVHYAAEQIGNLAISIAEECIERQLSDAERERLNLRYGPTSIAGGVNLVFLQSALHVDSEFRRDVLHLLNLPPNSTSDDLTKAKAGLFNHMMERSLYSLDQRAAEQARPHRRARKPALIGKQDNEVVAELKARQPDQQSPDDAAIAHEEFQSIEKLLEKLSEQDRTIYSEKASGLAPRDIAANHGEWRMTPKQIADRFRKIVQKLQTIAREMGIE